jgi:hypothetical protein
MLLGGIHPRIFRITDFAEMTNDCERVLSRQARFGLRKLIDGFMI